MSDTTLKKELAFAEGFGPTIAPNADVWLSALRTEAAARESANG